MGRAGTPERVGATGEAGTNGSAGRSGGGGSSSGWLAALAAIVVAAGVAALVAWLVADDSAGPDVGVTVQDVADAPEDYYGELVTVSGEVTDTVPAIAPTTAPSDPGTLAFSLGGDTVGEQVLVTSADASPFTVITGDSVVQVTGRVREFTRDRFGDIFGLDFFADPFFDEFEGRPVIVAQTVDPTVPPEDLGE